MAINLQYVKGKLDKALTRGDGVKGEDCTYAVMKYENWMRKELEKIETKREREMYMVQKSERMIW